MQVIYRPRGRALEYSYLACNLYGGVCPHRCSYCYVPSAMRMSRQQWEAKPWYVRKDILKWMRKDAERLAGTHERVLLCFNCDPYSSEAAQFGVTRQALEILQEFDIPWQILTKGGTSACRDFDLYGPNDAFATTLTFLYDLDSMNNEPGTASPIDRVAAIYKAKMRGIQTWVSLEPVIDPRQSLALIERTHESVDLYKIGKLNHDKAAEARIDWLAFGMKAIELCEKYGRPYYIKDDLAKHLVGVPFVNTDTRRISRGD